MKISCILNFVIIEPSHGDFKLNPLLPFALCCIACELLLVIRLFRSYEH